MSAAKAASFAIAWPPCWQVGHAWLGAGALLPSVLHAACRASRQLCSRHSETSVTEVGECMSE
eukprot:1138198-Pelagomonas_calceolata.AAC.8